MYRKSMLLVLPSALAMAAGLMFLGQGRAEAQKS